MEYPRKKAQMSPMLSGGIGGLYDINGLTVIFETKPECIQKVLPPMLQALELPYAVAFCNDIGATNCGPGYLEMGVVIPCKDKNGNLGSYIHSIPATGDMGLLTYREKWGFPKKMSNITVERDERHFKASVERYGVKFLELEATVSNQTNDPENYGPVCAQLFLKPEDGKGRNTYFTFKFSPSATGDGFEYPPRIYKVDTAKTTHFATLAIGKFEMNWSEQDPVALLEVVKVLGAGISLADVDLMPATLVEEVDPAAFAPYAYNFYDIPENQSKA